MAAVLSSQTARSIFLNCWTLPTIGRDHFGIIETLIALGSAIGNGPLLAMRHNYVSDFKLLQGIRSGISPISIVGTHDDSMDLNCSFHFAPGSVKFQNRNT